MRIVAIDPGVSGGIAWTDSDGIVQSVPMPEGLSAQADFIRSIKTAETIAVMEKTGTYKPGNSGVAAATFARHCGNLEAILYVLGISTEQVAPQTWMKSLGALPKEKPDRKRAIKEWAARCYPHLSVTLKTADSLAILAWRIKQCSGQQISPTSSPTKKRILRSPTV